MRAFPSICWRSHALLVSKKVCNHIFDILSYSRAIRRAKLPHFVLHVCDRAPREIFPGGTGYIRVSLFQYHNYIDRGFICPLVSWLATLLLFYFIFSLLLTFVNLCDGTHFAYRYFISGSGGIVDLLFLAFTIYYHFGFVLLVSV